MTVICRFRSRYEVCLVRLNEQSLNVSAITLLCEKCPKKTEYRWISRQSSGQCRRCNQLFMVHQNEQGEAVFYPRVNCFRCRTEHTPDVSATSRNVQNMVCTYTGEYFRQFWAVKEIESALQGKHRLLSRSTVSCGTTQHVGDTT